MARGIVQLERWKAQKEKHGNLDGIRGIIDFRDKADAFLCVETKGQVGHICNICNGQGLKVSKLFSRIRRLAYRQIRSTVDPLRSWLIDEPVCFGNPDRLKSPECNK
jgi:UDP-glucose 4-epimerase